MVIRLGYDIELELSRAMTVIAVLNVHPSRTADLIEPDELQISRGASRDEYMDSFGNRCTRILAPQGKLRLSNSTLIRDSGEPDPVNTRARQVPIEQLPTETLQFLLASRYCEVDRLSDLAWQLFGGVEPGWPVVQAICDWVHQNVTFGYQFARPTKTALDVSVERQGVCRDFQHLAITLCRAMHIPARYVTGYLGDIGVPPAPSPMDFSAWFEAFLDGRWWTFDARHNHPRIGRVLMATGRDAADVAITTSFGTSWLNRFSVVTEEAPQPEQVEEPSVEQESLEADEVASPMVRAAGVTAVLPNGEGAA
jgi:transglutaminase-like putative cysteine protease